MDKNCQRIRGTSDETKKRGAQEDARPHAWPFPALPCPVCGPVRLMKDLRKVALRIQERHSIARTRECSKQVGGGPKAAGANRGKRKRFKTTIETDG